MEFTGSHKGMIRLGVIGAGRMGTYHIRKFASIAGVSVIGYYDPNPLVHSQLTVVEGLNRFSSLDELLFEADAVVIASPTDSHFINGMRALQAGLHVLIEKPFCGSLDSA